MVHIGGFDLEVRPGIVAAIGENPLENVVKAKKLGADLIEIRIDLLGKNVLKSLSEIKSVGLPVIATNRIKEEGGSWMGSEEERISALIEAIPTVDAVDIELSAKDKGAVIEKARARDKTLIVSSHDFHGTPPKAEMQRILRQCMDAGGDIAKLAATPHSRGDIIDLIEVTLAAGAPVCTIAMGELGRASRIIMPFFGSVLTYGSVSQATAPGQLRVDEIKNILETLKII